MMMPAVTVIMPVYNAEPYLKEAIESILNQTFTEFEFFIIDDASTDKSVEIVKSFHDNRIVLLQKPINSGYTDSLNMAIPLAKGRYIARMDADDISLPDRFLKQYNYLEQHPDVLVLGTMCKIIGTEITTEYLPITYEQVKLFSFMQSPVAHPTVFIRRSVFDIYNLRYDRNFEPAEDYDLWTRIIDIGKIENLPDVLLHYRIHEKQVSSRENKKQTEMVNRIRLRQLPKLTISFSDEEFAGWLKLLNFTTFQSVDEKIIIIKSIKKIQKSNETLMLFEKDLFNNFLVNLTRRLCFFNSSGTSMRFFKYAFFSKLLRVREGYVLHCIKFFFKSILQSIHLKILHPK